MKILHTADEFKTLVKKIKQEMPNYKDPLAFGICKLNKENNNEVSYLVASSNENFSSAAIFIKALSEQGIEIDFNKSETICHINEAFIKSSLNAFAPFTAEAHGNSHKNIQVILDLNEELSCNGFLNLDLKIAFIFTQDRPKSVQVAQLKHLLKNEV